MSIGDFLTGLASGAEQPLSAWAGRKGKERRRLKDLSSIQGSGLYKKFYGEASPENVIKMQNLGLESAYMDALRQEQEQNLNTQTATAYMNLANQYGGAEAIPSADLTALFIKNQIDKNQLDSFFEPMKQKREERKTSAQVKKTEADTQYSQARTKATNYLTPLKGKQINTSTALSNARIGRIGMQNAKDRQNMAGHGSMGSMPSSGGSTPQPRMKPEVEALLKKIEGRSNMQRK